MSSLLALVASIGLAFQSAPQASVRGQVRSAADERALVGAAVRILDLDRTVAVNLNAPRSTSQSVSPKKDTTNKQEKTEGLPRQPCLVIATTKT